MAFKDFGDSFLFSSGQLINVSNIGGTRDTPPPPSSSPFLFNSTASPAASSSGVVFAGVLNFTFSHNPTLFPEQVPVESENYSSTVLVFITLCVFSLCIIFGNSLVIIAVVREHYLKSPTSYFIASLAAADLSVGLLLIPFEAITQLLNRRWIFGEVWCDLWHSFDVLVSTASILNLCVISLDRYWAICTPLSYPSRMNSKRAYKFIALVWILAVLISLPAIFWWRGVRETPVLPGTCPFTDDVGYVIASSCISFYIPLSVMLFVYYKIYMAAVKQSKSIKQGTKLFASTPENLTLRMHRGRGVTASCSSDITSGNGVVGPLLSQQRKSFSFGDCRSVAGEADNPGVTTNQQNGVTFLTVGPHHKRAISEKIHRKRPSFFQRLHKPSQATQSEFNSEMSESDADVFSTSSVDERQIHFHTSHNNRAGNNNHHHHNGLMSFRHGTRRSFTVARKLARFAKEKKAAKTLGVVLGVFIICWLPFFVLNILFAICRKCGEEHGILYEVATWLGWINSAMNPVIYACWSHDFRRAFVKFLCCNNTRCVHRDSSFARRQSSTRRLSVV